MAKNKKVKDLSNPIYAAESRNQTAITAITIMNLVLAAAYLIEVFKGARTMSSYLFVALCCFLPSAVAIFIFLKKPEAKIVRYVLAVGFSVFYADAMLTAKNMLVFCYVH